MTRIRFQLVLLAAIGAAPLALAEPADPIPLWPDGAPGEADLELPEESITLKGKYQIEILANVKNPTLTWYPADDPNGAAVVVCPGGGYNILAYSHEGREVCEWLNSLGVSAALLKYRVPRREGRPKHEAPLEDAQRAISMIRTHAEEWQVDPERIGVLGFSAGGHLASMALTSDGSRTYPPDPEFDSVGCVPNFAILVYPAYQLDEDNPDQLSPEVRVTEETPPAFLVVAHDDRKWAEGSARFYIEMSRKNRPAELHIFAKGGHGFGFEKTPEEVRRWPDLAGKWMSATGLLGEQP